VSIVSKVKKKLKNLWIPKYVCKNITAKTTISCPSFQEKASSASALAVLVFRTF